MQHTNTLRRHRKQWALTQQQVAELIGLRARSVVSSYELGHGTPNLRSALAFQLVFGVPLTALYPNLSEDIEDAVMRKALTLDEVHRGRNDGTAVRVRELLQRLLSQAGNTDGL